MQGDDTYAGPEEKDTVSAEFQVPPHARTPSIATSCPSTAHHLQQPRHCAVSPLLATEMPDLSNI